MPKKLNTFVHVVARDDDGNEVHNATFGPDDKLPAWAVKAITNPDVWAEGSNDEPEPVAEDNEELPAESAGGPPVISRREAQEIIGEPVRPPTSGAGSGRDAWAAYATSKNVAVTDDMSRDDIVAAVDGAGK